VYTCIILNESFCCNYRVLVVNIVAVGWNTYLAMMSEKVHPHDVQEVATETTQPSSL